MVPTTGHSEKGKRWRQYKDQCFQEPGGRRDEEVDCKVSQSSGNDAAVYNAAVMGACHYLSKCMECPTPEENPNVSYGLWAIMMLQCRFIDCNKCTVLGRGVGGC